MDQLPRAIKKRYYHSGMLLQDRESQLFVILVNREPLDVNRETLGEDDVTCYWHAYDLRGLDAWLSINALDFYYTPARDENDTERILFFEEG